MNTHSYGRNTTVEYQAAIDKIKMSSFTTLEQAAQRPDMVGTAAQKVVATLNS